MIFADRVEQNFIDPLVVAELEPKVGRACLDAIISFPIPDEVGGRLYLLSARIDGYTDSQLASGAAPI